MSYIDDKRYVLEHIDRRTLLEQLAEEAAELSQAALKLIRAEKAFRQSNTGQCINCIGATN